MASEQFTLTDEAQSSDRTKDTSKQVGTSVAITAGKGAATGAAAGTGAASGAGGALAAAWPLAILIGLYMQFKSYKEAKKAAGTNLTDEEVTAAIDLFGIEDNIEDYTPKEIRVDELRPLHLTGKIFGSGKHEDQIVRDRWRNNLEKGGVAVKGNDGSHYIELADGSMFNIGLDGHSTIQAADGSEIPIYNTDPSNPLTQQAVGFANPIAAMMAGGDEKVTSDGAGILSNAFMANATTIEDVQANAKHFYDQAFGAAAAESGVPVDDLALGSLQTLYDQGMISEEQFIAYSNGIRQTYGHSELTSPGTPLQQDPAHVEGIQAGDPVRGDATSTATAGVVLDSPEGVDSMGNPTPDAMPSTGSPKSAIPKPMERQQFEAELEQQQAQMQQQAEMQQQQQPTNFFQQTGDQLRNPQGTQQPQQMNPGVPTEVPRQQQTVDPVTQAMDRPSTRSAISDQAAPADQQVLRSNTVSKEDIGVGEIPANTVNQSAQQAKQNAPLSFEEQSALIDKQFNNQKILQDEALSANAQQQRQSILGNMAASELNKQQGFNQGALGRSSRGRTGQNSQNLINILGV